MIWIRTSNLQKRDLYTLLRSSFSLSFLFIYFYGGLRPVHYISFYPHLSPFGFISPTLVQTLNLDIWTDNLSNYLQNYTFIIIYEIQQDISYIPTSTKSITCSKFTQLGIALGDQDALGMKKTYLSFEKCPLICLD